MLDMELCADLFNILVFERATIFSNNSQRDSMMTYDVIKDKLINLDVGDVSHRNGFNPFGKVLRSYDNELMFLGRSRVNLTYEVESPL